MCAVHNYKHIVYTNYFWHLTSPADSKSDTVCLLFRLTTIAQFNMTIKVIFIMSVRIFVQSSAFGKTFIQCAGAEHRNCRHVSGSTVPWNGGRRCLRNGMVLHRSDTYSNIFTADCCIAGFRAIFFFLGGGLVRNVYPAVMRFAYRVGWLHVLWFSSAFYDWVSGDCTLPWNKLSCFVRESFRVPIPP